MHVHCHYSKQVSRQVGQKIYQNCIRTACMFAMEKYFLQGIRAIFKVHCIFTLIIALKKLFKTYFPEYIQCDIKHFLFIERLLAAQNPLAQADRPHQLFADAPPAPVAAAPATAAAVMPPAVMAVPVPSSIPSAPNMPPSGPPMPPVPPGMPPPGKLSLKCMLCFFISVYGKTELV